MARAETLASSFSVSTSMMLPALDALAMSMFACFSKCGNNSQERCPLARHQRFVKRIRGIIRFRRLLFFGAE